MSSRNANSKRRSSPAKKLAKKIEGVEHEPEDIPVPEPSSHPRKSPANRSGLKRKGAPVASDSEIEVLDGSTVSPKKKKAASRRPSPGEEGFDTLPAVSISAMVDVALFGSKPIDFGSTAGSKSNDKDVSPPRTRSRVRVKTEKARLIEEDEIVVASKGRDATTKHSRSVSEAIEVSDDGSLPQIPIPIKINSSARTPRVNHVIPALKMSSRTVPDGDVDSDASDVRSESPKPVKGRAANAKATDNPLDLESDTGEVCDESDAASSVDVKGTSDALKSKARESAHDREEAVDAVMSKSAQDPALYEIYKNLPRLDCFCDVQAYSHHDSVESCRVIFSHLAKVLPESATDSLLKGLLFVKSDYFVNTSRIHPNLLAVDSQRLKIAGSSNNAVCIMLGVTTECFLVETGTGGSPSAPYPVHKVTIAPFAQEMRRDTSLWGQLFRFNVVSGTVSGLGISFLTRKEGSGLSYQQVPETPKKKGDFFTSVTSPLASRSTGQRGTLYPSSHAFNEKVPIYDGRQSFHFTDANFQNLSGWPLYKGGRRDLPDNSVVAVGYTLSTYVGGNSGATCLSSNVQFVILLGLTGAPVL